MVVGSYSSPHTTLSKIAGGGVNRLSFVSQALPRPVSHCSSTCILASLSEPLLMYSKFSPCHCQHSLLSFPSFCGQPHIHYIHTYRGEFAFPMCCFLYVLVLSLNNNLSQSVCVFVYLFPKPTVLCMSVLAALVPDLWVRGKEGREEHRTQYSTLLTSTVSPLSQSMTRRG